MKADKQKDKKKGKEAEKDTQITKKNMEDDIEGLLNRAGNASLDPDIEIIFEDIKNHWIYKIKENIHLNTANDVFYAKKVDDHIEVGIAKVDLIR